MDSPEKDGLDARDLALLTEIRDSPYERGLRKAAAIPTWQCLVCGSRHANEGLFCDEFCEVLAELGEAGP